MKWARKQPTIRGGWCALPITIAHRFGGIYSMVTLMREIEMTFGVLHRSVSTVVGNPDQEKETKWVSEAEIGVMTKVFAVPRKDDKGASVSEQEAALRRHENPSIRTVNPPC